MHYQKNRICIFGGAFNPIHHGHLIIADQVKQCLDLDKIIFVPSGNAAFKGVIGNDDHRIKMIELAINNIDYFEVSDFEIKRKEKTYSIDTVKNFINEDTELFFLVGEDSFYDIELWKDFKELMNLVTFVVSGRKFEKHDFENKVKKIKEYGKKPVFIDTPVIEISSSEIKKRVKNNMSINFLTNEKVVEYIKRKNLYV